MGMTIEELVAENDRLNRQLAYESTALTMMKADYENRLKADMLAMLTDFLMDIEENTSINATNSDERNGKRLMRTEIIGMFEQKIKLLKEGKSHDAIEV